jgi:hypothetical protein
MSLPPPRSAAAHSAFLHELRAEHGAALGSPPDSAAEQWNRAELRRWAASGGKWRPLLERTQSGLLLAKLGWRARLQRAKPAPLRVVQLEGGAMGASEGRAESFGVVARALAEDGVCALNFGVAGRYTDLDVWAEAAAECTSARAAMRPVAGAESREANVLAAALAASRGVAPGTPHALQAVCPVLHGLHQSTTNFVMGLRAELASAEGGLGLALTAYTDCKISCLADGDPAGGPRFDRDTAGAGGEERRVDASDGCACTPLSPHCPRSHALTPSPPRRHACRV